MKARVRAKRGIAARRLDALDQLRRALVIEATPEDLLRATARVLAAAFGDYCVADMIDRRGSASRLVIAHPDESRFVKLDVAVELARKELAVNVRIERLLAIGTGEMMARVGAGYRARSLGDLLLLAGVDVQSYMASIVWTSGAPIGVLTMARAHALKRYRDDDHAFLDAAAEWTGLAMENALRRERQPRASGSPPALSSRPPKMGRVSGK